MKKLTAKQITKIKANTLRLQASNRGGGIEINLTAFGFKGQKMTAYQNYLGGGMLGSIQNDCTIPDWNDNEKLKAIANQLAQYFHNITNHEDDEWENASFENNQKRPASAY
jgi:hypothetical protein